jgi:hypothetical protein
MLSPSKLKTEIAPMHELLAEKCSRAREMTNKTDYKNVPNPKLSTRCTENNVCYFNAVCYNAVQCLQANWSTMVDF